MSEKVGRPPIYDDPEEMEEDIEEYFNKCELNDQPKTILGLCNHLDMHRSTLIEYEGKPEFSNTVKKAKQRIEEHINNNLLTGEYNATGCIFNLKNNFDWEDKRKEEVEHKGGLDIKSLHERAKDAEE